MPKEALDPRGLAIRLTCVDYRLSANEFGVSRPALYDAVKRLPEPTVHLRYLKPLGFRNIVIGIRDKELWRRLLPVKKVKEINGVPFPRLVSTVVLLLGGLVHVNYVVHESIFHEVFQEIEDWIHKTSRESSVEYFFSAESIPIRNCSGKQSLSNDTVESIISTLEELLEVTVYRSRMPFLDYIIIAALDLFPKLTPRQLSRLVYVAQARLEKELDKWSASELKYRFVRRHYTALSQAGLIGRIWAPRAISAGCVERLFLLAQGDCFRKLYVVASATLGSANLIVSREYVVAGLGVAPSFRAEVLRRIADCVVKPLVSYRAIVAPLPFEFYDPVTRKWYTEPVSYDLYELLRRFRLVDNRL